MAVFRRESDDVAVVDQALLTADEFFAVSYVLIAMVFAWKTFQEGRLAGAAWDLPRIVGLLSCAVWPLVLLGVAFALTFAGRDMSRPAAISLRRFAGGSIGRKVMLFGIPVVDKSFDDAVRSAGAMAGGQRCSTLYFVNAHTLNLASQSFEYAKVLRSADVVFGDGTGVRWAARLRGNRLAANLNGTDLIPALLGRQPGLRCFILGSAPERIAHIGKDFAKRFPKAELVGLHHGYLDHEASLGVVEQINAARPDLLLVGMGNPLQEQWIHRYRSRLDVGLAVGVGGLFEYWSGMLDRAPLWMRRAGIEWVHILRRQPWKTRRYLIGNVEFMWRSLSWLYVDLRKQGAAA